MQNCKTDQNSMNMFGKCMNDMGFHWLSTTHNNNNNTVIIVFDFNWARALFSLDFILIVHFGLYNLCQQIFPCNVSVAMIFFLLSISILLYFCALHSVIRFTQLPLFNQLSWSLFKLHRSMAHCLPHIWAHTAPAQTHTHTQQIMR